jgi:hypothetical protein
MSRIVSAFLAIVLALCLTLPAQAQTTQRPLSDFLSAQGTYCVDNGMGGCYLFVPPDPNFLGFGTIYPAAADSTYQGRGYLKKSSTVYFAGVDYAGLAAAWENNTGTNPVKLKVPVISGTVTERPLPDGKAEVTVVMHTKGANIWVIELDVSGDQLDQIANKPTLFGHRPSDVAMGEAVPALADTLLHVVFTIDKPGAPLPDLVAINYTPAEKFVAFNAQGEGPLTILYGVPEGTPGKCQITQTGLFDVTFKQLSEEFKGKAGLNSRVAYDFFPVENINLQVVGKGK